MVPAAAYREGASALASFYPTTQNGVLISTAAASGVPTPDISTLAFYTTPMIARTVQIVPNNPVRSFLLIYNPTQAPAQLSKSTATYGAMSNLPIGPGEAYFWATSQGLLPVYQGPLTAIGQPGSFLWAWEDNSQLTVNLLDDLGVLQLSGPPVGLAYPTSPTGLPAGAVWDNGLTISIIPGITPNPAALPVFFGSVTAATLLAIGGGDFPLSDPHTLNQLWNNGGLTCVSGG